MVSSMARSQGMPRNGVYAVDALHQGEGRTEWGGVGLGGDQARVRHGRVAQGGQDGGLAAHGLVSAVARAGWGQSQDEPAPAVAEFEHAILRAAAERAEVVTGPGPSTRRSIHRVSVARSIGDGPSAARPLDTITVLPTRRRRGRPR